MQTELEFMESQIEKRLNEMSSVFSDLQFKHQIATEHDDNLLLEISDIEDRFEVLAKIAYKMCLVYFETRQLRELLTTFKGEMHPVLLDRTKILAGTYHEEIGEEFSDLLDRFWSYLIIFPAFGDRDDVALLKRTGISYLENILESTAVIIHGLDKDPDSESQVYEAVKIVSQAAFPSASFPTESFQKTASCYKPDILIPMLNCAVEYKYAATERKLIDTIDQILVDVKGYDKHPVYKLFYAVFYVKTGIWSRTRFNAVWKEKDFPENWKGIFVEAV